MRLNSTRFVSSLLLAASLLMPGLAAANQPVADFRLPQLAGPPMSLNDTLQSDETKLILMAFWATWCSPCKAEMPHLQNLNNAYGEHGLAVWGINTDEARNRAQVNSEVRSRRLEYTILMDSETEVLSRLNPSMNLPYSMLVSEEGVAVATHTGYTPGDEVKLEQEIREFLGVGDDVPRVYQEESE